jgi:uncharacterized protein (UPF0210 family)
MQNKVIRSICYFTDAPSADTIKKVNQIADIFIKNNYVIQTKRICSPDKVKIRELDQKFGNEFTFCLGPLTREEITNQFDSLFSNVNTHFNRDLTDKQIDLSDAQILFDIVKKKPDKTFNFTYVFNNAASTPFFPSATYSQNGFSIGLQSTDLSLGCKSAEEWSSKMREAWSEIVQLLNERQDFLGIDSSVAPMVSQEGSFVGFIKRLGLDFSHTTTTDFYLKITKFIKTENPKPIGLCGLMFPCLEDGELAEEYEKGNFSIERNIYLSLHSGLGIDTYTIGIDEARDRILEILKLVQGLSNKYKKPLSARFVSDGKAKIGEKTDFKNQYLRDVVVRKI